MGEPAEERCEAVGRLRKLGVHAARAACRGLPPGRAQRLKPASCPASRDDTHRRGLAAHARYSLAEHPELGPLPADRAGDPGGVGQDVRLAALDPARAASWTRRPPGSR